MLGVQIAAKNRKSKGKARESITYAFRVESRSPDNLLYLTKENQKMSEEIREATINDILDRTMLHRQALGFVADRVQDNQVSCNLALIEQAMEKTESMLQYLIGIDV